MSILTKDELRNFADLIKDNGVSHRQYEMWLGNVLDNYINTAHRNNSIIVNEKSDLPSPSGGKITLQADTEYFINGTVNIGTDEIHYSSGSYLAGLNITKDYIQYTGTGSALNSNNVGQIVGKWFGVIAPAGSAINFRETDTSSPQLNLEYIGFLGCNSIGTIEGFNVASLKSCAHLGVTGLPAGNGITFTGSPNKIFVDASVFQELTSPDYAIKFDSSFNGDVVDLVSSYFKFDGVTGIEVDPSANIRVGRLRGCIFTGTKSSGAVTGFDRSTIGWEFTLNDGVDDSNINANYYIADASGSFTTSISAVDTPTKVNATTTLSSGSEKFTHTNNRATYKGLKTIPVEIMATLSLESANNNQTIEFLLYKNGSLIDGSRSQIILGTGNTRQGVTILGSTTLSTDDYIEIWVVNKTSGADVTVYTLNTVIK